MSNTKPDPEKVRKITNFISTLVSTICAALCALLTSCTFL